ncbi:MAG TPA: PDZ domain-containing protein [Terriglobia bacterium]|nr:PDZ domain-containing protein [Terriglobia bacterium]
MRKPFNTVIALLRCSQAVPCLVTVLCLLVAGSAVARTQDTSIRYLLDLRKPASHLVDVTMNVPDAAAETEFQVPAWNNLYQIRDFVRDVQNVEAQCQGRPAQLRRVDINTWASVGGCADLEIHYEVYANQEGVFSAILDSRHAFLNFALLLFYLPNERQRPVRVKFLLPDGWKLVTMLDDGLSPGEYQAPNYDRLVDSPAEAGKFQEYDYVQAGAEYRITIDGEQDLYSPQRLLEVLKKITSKETALMQDVPFKRYTFMFFFPEKGEGGMEHCDGTAISIPADRMRTGLDTLEVIAAHEFFHLWNVKRIRPQGLEPIDYIHGNDTSDLWFSEGVTSTYAQLVLLRSGLIDSKQFYAHLAEGVRQLKSRPARNLQSAEESGREAWLEKYPDYSRPERSISYYNKGELLGYLLDLGIRHASDNRFSLDDVMRQLNRDFAARGRFFSDADLENIIAQLAPAFPVQEFFRTNINGTGDLDYGKYLGYAGLALKIETQEVPDLGFDSLQAFEGPIQVEAVVPDSSAEKAGLRAGDVLLTMNGVELPVTPDRELIYFKPGQNVVFTVRRGAKVLDIAFVLGSKNALVYHIEEMPNATQSQLAVRRGWLKGELRKGAAAVN